MGETRVDLLHLLEDLRDAYPGTIEETIVTEAVANALDSGATIIRIDTDSAASTFTVLDNGKGMRRGELRRFHDIASTTKARGQGIGFAGVGIKLGLLISEEVFTETRRQNEHVATTWRLSSKRRAPWDWVNPLGLVSKSGTAVRLHLSNPLTPLLGGRFVERIIHAQFQPLLDASFDEILSQQYPGAIRLILDGRDLQRRGGAEKERAPIVVKLPRKHKPSALGYLTRQDSPYPENQQGIAISTFGKVIKRGWDWLGISPTDPERISGLIEAPALASCIQLNKADFIPSGSHRALYLAFRKAIQEAVIAQLAEWGVARGQPQQDRRRGTRPMERDLERVLNELTDEYPLLPTLTERRAGGQQRLPIGVAHEGSRATLMVPGPQPAQEGMTKPSPDSSGAAPDEPPKKSPPPPATSFLNPGSKGPRRPSRPRLRIRYEQRSDQKDLSRLAESTIYVNEAHPAYVRAVASRSSGYHVALAAAMAVGKLVVEPTHEHDFINTFMRRWGETGEARSNGNRSNGGRRKRKSKR